MTANLLRISPNRSKVDMNGICGDSCARHHSWGRWRMHLPARRSRQLRLRLEGAPIPLPPLEEQQRIADILDRAEALRAKRRAALAKLDTLTHAIFSEMFGDPALNPKHLICKAVGDLDTARQRRK